jgi:hypothetical protein
MKPHVFDTTLLGVQIAVTGPRRLPSAQRLNGKVAMLDLAFAHSKASGSYASITHKLIHNLGDRLALFLDHHDSIFHQDFTDDNRFYLATKAEHGACPEMITPDLYTKIGTVDCILCHCDFDGLASAAKWLLKGHEPYSGCDYDAWCVDTRLAEAKPKGLRLERALRGMPQSPAVIWAVLNQLVYGLAWEGGWDLIDQAVEIALQREKNAEDLAQAYRVLSSQVVFVDATYCDRDYDRTHLLLLGQKKSKIAVIRVRDSLTFACGFDSGINFLKLFGLSGGMPTVASVPLKYIKRYMSKLNVDRWQVLQLLDDLDLHHLM